MALIMDDMGGPPQFEFPKNLKDMSWEDRQKLHDQYAAHIATVSGSLAKNVVELDVAKEIQVEDDDGDDDWNDGKLSKGSNPDATAATVYGATFDPEKGYIISGEDPWLLASMGKITPEEAEAMAASGNRGTRALSDEDVSAAKAADVRRKVAALPSSSRDAVERFGRL